MRDQLLFMGGGEEDSGEDLIIFRGKGRRISRRRQSKKWDCSELTVNLLPTSNEVGRGGGIARILQGLMRGSSKFYRDITDILRNSYISFYPDRLRSLLPPETPEVSLEPGTPA